MNTRSIIACAFALCSAVVSLASGQIAPAAIALGDIAQTIRDSPHITIFDDVDVRLDGESVVLTGKVTAGAKRAEIARQVSRLDGVRAIRNEILVLPAAPEDDNLRHRIAKSIYGNPSFWSYAAMARPPIHIIVERGHVTLKGTVGTTVERSMAGSLATGLGERSLINQLQTEAHRFHAASSTR